MCIRLARTTYDNKYLVSASYDRKIEIYDFATKIPLIIDGDDNYHEDMAPINLSEDEKYIISGYGKHGLIKIWNFRNDEPMGSLRRTIAVNQSGIQDLCMTWNN